MNTNPDRTETDRLHAEILEGKAEISKLRDLLRSENQRANAAIGRETTAEQAAIEAQEDNRRLRAVVARIAQMTDYWEQRLPEVIRTPAVVSAIRAALENAGPRLAAEAPTTTKPCPDPVECSHEAALGQAREIVRRLAAHAVGFQDVLDDSDRDPWAKTVGADIAALQAALSAVGVGQDGAQP